MPPTLAIIKQTEELLSHDFGPWHPLKNRERFEKYMALIEQHGITKLPWVKLITPTKVATEEDILAVHDQSLIDLIKRLSKTGGMLDGDTPVPPGTYERTLIQAGASMEAVESIMRGEYVRAIQCIAFGGHHATRRHVGRSFGFCYFNHEGVAMRYLQRIGLAKRFFVLDCDAHHGNGIQDIFYDDPTVLYMSLHQDPLTLYPGTGFVHEVGSGKGEGYNVNVPLPPGTTNQSYIRALKEVFVPLFKEYKPDMLVYLLGADTYFADPLTMLKLTLSYYSEAAKLVVDCANEVCGGRIFTILAGGYHVDATARAFCIGTARLAEVEPPDLPDEPGAPTEEDPRVTARVDKVLSELKQVLSKYWSCFA